MRGLRHITSLPLTKAIPLICQIFCVLQLRLNFSLCPINKTVCSHSVPLGMEAGTIPDNKITVSSTHANSEATWGRLHYTSGSWTPVADSGDQWFQVDFVPEVKLVTRIATQGNGGSWWWVTTYYIMYKTGGAALEEYKEINQRVVSKVLTKIKWTVGKQCALLFYIEVIYFWSTCSSCKLAGRLIYTSVFLHYIKYDIVSLINWINE